METRRKDASKKALEERVGRPARKDKGGRAGDKAAPREEEPYDLNMLLGGQSLGEALSAPRGKKRPSSEAELETKEAKLGFRTFEAEAPSDAKPFPPCALPAKLSALGDGLLRAQSAGAVLTQAAPVVDELAGVAADSEDARLGEVAVALQAVGRWSSGRPNSHLLRDKRLAALLEVVSANAALLEPWAILSCLRGCALLGHAPTDAGTALLRLAHERLAEFDAEQAAVLLRTLAQGPQQGSRLAVDTRDALVTILAQRHAELEPRTCAELVPAIVRLRVTDSALTAALADGVARNAASLKVQDVAAASAGLVGLRVVSAPLLEQADKALRENAQLCTPRSVVQLAAALAETGNVDSFRDYLLPAARSFVNDFNARDVCTLAEAFVKVQAADADFLAELAHALLPKVADCRSHEVSVALNVFAPVSYAVPELFPELVQRLADTVEDLSPRQLAMAVRGVAGAGAGDASLYAAIRERAAGLSRALYGTNAVDVLLALHQASELDVASLQALLGAASRHLDKMPATDYIALLWVTSTLPDGLASHVPAGLHEDCLHALRRRGYGAWRLDLEAVVHLLEALHSCRLEDEALLELALDRLPAALRRSPHPLDMLVRLLEALADLPPRSRLHVRTHLHRRPRLVAALRRCLGRHLRRRMDLESEVTVIRVLADLGFDDPLTQEWLDRVLSMLPGQLDPATPDLTCELCWALAEFDWQVDAARRFARGFIKKRYPAWTPRYGSLEADDAEGDSDAEASDTEDVVTTFAETRPESLLRLAWALAAMNEEIPQPLIQDLHRAYEGRLPSDWGGAGLRMLQHVALHRDLLEMPAEAAEGDSLDDSTREWLELALEVPREDLYSRQRMPRQERRQQQRTSAGPAVQSYPYEQWLSVALSQLHIPHQAGLAVRNVHRAAVAFPRQKQLIDVVAHTELTAPACRETGTARLRRRQFHQLGWAVHPLSLREVYSAMKRGALKLLVSKLLRSFDPDAARRAPKTTYRGSALDGAQQKTLQVLGKPQGRGSKAGVRDHVDDELAWTDDEDAGPGADDVGSLRPRGPREVLVERARLAARLATVPQLRDELGEEAAAPKTR